MVPPPNTSKDKTPPNKSKSSTMPNVKVRPTPAFLTQNPGPFTEPKAVVPPIQAKRIPQNYISKPTESTYVNENRPLPSREKPRIASNKPTFLK